MGICITLLSKLYARENVAFYTKQDFLFDRYHFNGSSSSETKEARFRFLEIEANAVLYWHPKLGFCLRQPRTRPKLVWCEATRLRITTFGKKTIPPKLLFMLVPYPGRIEIWRVGFCEGWKPESLKKTLGARREPTTLSTHIWHWAESNPGHILRRRAHSPLCSHVQSSAFVHPCATIISYLLLSDHHLKIKISCETSSRIAINVEKVIFEPKAEEELVDLEC